MKWSDIQLDPVRGSHVFSTCDLHAEELTSKDLHQLAEYPHLQKLFVHNNRIKTLAPLAKLRALTYIDASNNSLERALDFFPRECKLVTNAPEEDTTRHDHEGAFSDGDMCIGSQLVVAVLRSNHISILEDLYWHRRLEELDLGQNRIADVGDALRNLSALRRLDLSHNCLRDLKGIEAATRLEELVIDGNYITNLGGIHNLQELVKLSARGNYIYSISEVKFCPLLQVLQLQNNNIGCFDQLRELSGLEYLSQVSFQGNGIAQTENYRDTVVFLLQQVDTVDGANVSHADKVHALNLFGEDLASRKGYYLKHIDQPFKNFCEVLAVPETQEGPGLCRIQDVVADAMRSAVVGCLHRKPKNCGISKLS